MKRQAIESLVWQQVEAWEEMGVMISVVVTDDGRVGDSTPKCRTDK